MAQDITLDIGATSAFTITLASLADGSNISSSAKDLGSPAPAEIGIRVKLKGASSACVDYAELYARWGTATTASTFDTSQNQQPIGFVQMQGTATVQRHVTVPVLQRYVILNVANESGAAFATSGMDAALYEIAIDQA